jgi:hypothetical protein
MRDVQHLMKLFSVVREQERRMVLSAGDVGDDVSGSGQNSEMISGSESESDGSDSDQESLFSDSDN